MAVANLELHHLAAGLHDERQLNFILRFAERYGRVARPLVGGLQMLDFAFQFTDPDVVNGVAAISTWIRDKDSTGNFAQTRALREVLQGDDELFRPRR